MNLAIFGGTFDPIHRGHMAIAQAAASRFHLQRVLFVPAELPPHKVRSPITPFAHRYAMVALATREQKDFIPSLLEAPTPGRDPVINFSIDTVRRVKKTLRKADRLFFLTGVDAFLEIATWKEPVALLREVEFIVASRPGFSLGDIGAALPASLRPSEAVLKALRRQSAEGTIALPGITIHLMAELAEKASATAVRGALHQGRAAGRWLDPAVAAYIKKMRLYQQPPRAARAAGGATKVLSFQKTKPGKKEAR